MELHHQKHHQTYITNLNAALAAQAKATQAHDVTQLISLQQKIKFNGGGHINHSLFWKNLTPPESSEAAIDAAAPTLKQAITSRWGSVEKFVDAFKTALLGIQGSGWGWLVANGGANGKLEIVTTKDQDPVTEPQIPIFGVDMWEHAYYLQVRIQENSQLYFLLESC
jgi:Fe-Mn family superoxide dismutase